MSQQAAQRSVQEKPKRKQTSDTPIVLLIFLEWRCLQSLVLTVPAPHTPTPQPPRYPRLPRPPLIPANHFRLKLVAPALNWYPGWGSNPQDLRR